jgi:signal transduction histidine kinase
VIRSTDARYLPALPGESRIPIVTPSPTASDSQGRGIPLRLRPTDLRALLRSHLVVMRAQAAAVDVSLTAVIADNVPDVVQLDPEKVGWAITTLIGNALRYVRHGSRQQSGAIAVSVTNDTAHSSVIVEVRDDGPGIVPAAVRRLFNVDDPHGPSGLGLLLVYDIVVAHGGSVEVTSSTGLKDSGTTIRFSIPTS